MPISPETIEIEPVSVTVACGGALHTVALTADGRLQLLDHAGDPAYVQAETAADALGAEHHSGCYAILKAWRTFDYHTRTQSSLPEPPLHARTLLASYALKREVARAILRDWTGKTVRTSDGHLHAVPDIIIDFRMLIPEIDDPPKEPDKP